MCEHCNENIISHCAFLMFLQVYKIFRKMFFKLDSYCVSREKAMAFIVMFYFSLQSNSSLLKLVLLSMKWSLPYPARPKIRLRI